MYDSCNECPRNNTKECPFGHWSQRMRSNICQFLRLPLRPFHSDNWIEKEAEKIARKIKCLGLSGSQTPQETEYGYEDFHHIAFAAGTPEKQARHFQDVLVSTAAICDFRKLDITRCRFFVKDSGEARGELPEIPLS